MTAALRNRPSALTSKVSLGTVAPQKERLLNTGKRLGLFQRTDDADNADDFAPGERQADPNPPPEQVPRLSNSKPSDQTKRA